MMPSSPGPTLICLSTASVFRSNIVTVWSPLFVVKPWPDLGGDAGAVHARRVWNVAEHFAGGAFDHHHVVGTRHEHAARGGFDGDIVGAAIAFDVELFDLERLCRRDAGRGKAGCREQDKCGQKMSGHDDLGGAAGSGATPR